MTTLYPSFKSTVLLLVILAGVASSQDYVYSSTLVDSFDGWAAYRGNNKLSSIEDIWSLENGVLRGHSNERLPEVRWLVSDTLYEDFIITFQFKIITGNSGLNIRSFLGDESVEGLQADMSHPGSGRLYEAIVQNNNYMGEYQVPLMDNYANIYKEDDWNSMEVQIKDNLLKIFLNDELASEYEMDPTIEPGFFAWQLHQGQVMDFSVRNIKISQWEEIVTIESNSKFKTPRLNGKTSSISTIDWKVRLFDSNMEFDFRGKRLPIYP